MPDSVGLELKSLGALPVKRLTPNVRVQAISRDNSNMRWSGMNGIGPIPRNCTITFIITNPEIFPPLSKVEWMVRNAGEEAENTNDLGHRAGMGLTAEERSAYKGTHYMDCVVKYGLVIGIRRVLVTISGMYAPKRNPRRPDYVKLRGHR